VDMVSTDSTPSVILPGIEFTLSQNDNQDSITINRLGTYIWIT